MATSYLNPGGTGDRQAIINIDSSLLPAVDGNAEQLIDGLQADGYKWIGEVSDWGELGPPWIQFDFGPGVAKIITEAKLYCDTTSGISHGKWAWQVSNTAAAGSWVTVSSAYQIGSNVDPIIVMQLPNGWTDLGYRYYRLLLVQGYTEAHVYKREIEFKIDDAVDSVSITQLPMGSPDPVASAGTVNCTTAAVDNMNHTVSYLWTTVDGGSFNDATLQNPIWTAPANAAGSTLYYTISVTATCNGTPGDSDNKSYEQGVLSTSTDIVNITQLPTGTSNPAISAGTVQCSVLATDTIGHTISYYWTSPTGGTFNDNTLRQPIWTAPVNITGSTVNYNIGVTATCNGPVPKLDVETYVQGVLTAGSDTVTITQLPAGNPTNVISAGTVNCTTLAVDNLGHTVSYLWTTVDGGSFNDATLRNPVWTAPANVTGSTVNYTIGVTATCNDGTPATDTESYEQGVLTAATADTVTITQLPVGGTNPVASEGTVQCTTLAVDNLSHTVSYLWVTPDGGSFDNATLQNPVWTAPANTTNATVNYTIGVTATCNGTPANTDYKTYEQGVLTTPISTSSNDRNFYKLGGPHSTPTVITTDGWLGVQTNAPNYTIDALGKIQAQESLWGSSKTILDGIQIVDLDDCNMITCTLTQNTILTAIGGHVGQLVAFVFTEDTTGDWTVTFGSGFNVTSVKSGLANKLIGVVFAYDGSVWKELGGSDAIPGLINQSLRHDGDEWIANNILKINVDGAEVTTDHTLGNSPRLPDLVYSTSALVSAASVPEGTLGVLLGGTEGVVGGALPAGTINQSLRHDGDGWIANNTLLIDETLGVAVPATGYYNFNLPFGTTGYGFRDNIGNIQYKNLGGAWTNIQNPSGVIDHGNLTGLTDQADHTWTLVVDGSRPLTADWDIGNGRTIKAESVIARDADGLVLREDSDTYGIQIEDDGDIVVTLGDNAGVRRINILDSDGVVESIISSDGNIAAAANGYYNFGTTLGSTGYGFRDNGATVQYKNSGGAWANISGTVDHGDLTGLTDSADHAWALLIDGTRPLTGDWDIGNGRTVKGESFIARDADGIVIREDSDTYGLQIEDDGDVFITLGDNSGARRINVADSDGVIQSIISSDGDIAAAGSGHYNFGSTLGDTGYGFRDTGSKVQFKHPAGSWIDVGTGGGGTPGGTDTQVQFNDATTFGGDAGLTYNKTSNTVTMGKGIRTEGHASGVVEIPSMVYIASGVIAPAASGYAIGTVLLVYNP